MSCTELHTGKFSILTQTTEDTFNFITKNLSKYWKPEISSRGYVNIEETDAYDEEYWLANKNFPYKILNVGNQSYLIWMINHKKFEEDEYPLEVSKNEDVGYNIGTNGADYPGYNNKERNGKFLIGVKNEFMTRLGNKGFAFTDKNPKELEPFDTSHSDRKTERITKRTEKTINEEFAKFVNFSIGAKQTIANIGDTVLKQL